LDTAHYQAAGGNQSTPFVSTPIDCCFCIRTQQRCQAPNAYRFVELGEGRVPLVAVLAELARIRFDGWAIVELDGVPDPARTPRDCTRISKHFLESHGYTV
jgi:inosose dehydratase